MQLNLFSYKALETKIANSKPKELQSIAEDLINSVYYYRNDRQSIKEDIEHYIYCLKGTVLAINRMEEISKLKITKSLKEIYSYCLKKLTKNLTTENIEELKIDSLKEIFEFKECYIELRINKLNDISVIEKLYFKYLKGINSDKFNISLSLNYFNYELSTNERKTIIKKWMELNCSKEFIDANVIKLSTTKELKDEFIEELNEMHKIVNIIKGEQDEIQQAIN